MQPLIDWCAAPQRTASTHPPQAVMAAELDAHRDELARVYGSSTCRHSTAFTPLAQQRWIASKTDQSEGKAHLHRFVATNVLGHFEHLIWVFCRVVPGAFKGNDIAPLDCHWIRKIGELVVEVVAFGFHQTHIIFFLFEPHAVTAPQHMHVRHHAQNIEAQELRKRKLEQVFVGWIPRRDFKMKFPTGNIMTCRSVDSRVRNA